MHLIHYLNPFSPHFHACKDFSEQLALTQKIKVIAITILFTPLAILGGVVAFRLMVAYYIVKKPVTPLPEKTKEVALPIIKPSPKTSLTPGPSLIKRVETATPSPVIPIPEISKVEAPIINEPQIAEPVQRVRSLKEKRSRSLSMAEQDQIAELPYSRLIEYVVNLDLELLEAFWKQESQHACQAMDKQGVEKARARFKVILEYLSDANFEQSARYNFFWLIFSNAHYNRSLNQLGPRHFTMLAKCVREAVLKGNEYGKVAVKCMETIIGLIPHDKMLPNYIEGICQNALPEWELILKGKLRRTGKRKAELEKLLDNSLKKYETEKRGSLPPSPVKKWIPVAERTWRHSAPAQIKPTVVTFTEPEKYHSHLSKFKAEQLLQGNDPIHNSLHEDLFFWILENFEEPFLEKKTRFTKEFFLGHVNPEEYLRLEKMTDEMLCHLVGTLDEKGLEILWQQEKRASSCYNGAREIQRLRTRLLLELSGLTENQFKHSLKLDIFWVLITGLEYKSTVASSLSQQKYQWMAEFVAARSDDYQAQCLANFIIIGKGSKGIKIETAKIEEQQKLIKERKAAKIEKRAIEEEELNLQFQEIELAAEEELFKWDEFELNLLAAEKLKVLESGLSFFQIESIKPEVSQLQPDVSALPDNASNIEEPEILDQTLSQV